MILTLGIPEHAELLVSTGDHVARGDPLFKIETAQDVEIAVAEPLGIKPHDIFSVFTKTIGDTVSVGEVIAHKKKLLSTRSLPSPVSGSIISISHDHGSITVSTKSEAPHTAPSFFSASIADVSPHSQEFDIDISGTEFELTMAEKDGGGPVFAAVTQDPYLTNIGDEIQGKILIIKTIQSHSETKCDALGGAGIVYLEGTAQTDFPSWKVKNEGEFTKITDSKRDFVVISSKNKKGLMYE